MIQESSLKMIENLPVELQARIFGRLDQRSLCMFSETCRAADAMVQADSERWRYALMGHAQGPLPERPRALAIRSNEQRVRAIVRLALRNATQAALYGYGFPAPPPPPHHFGFDY